MLSSKEFAHCDDFFLSIWYLVDNQYPICICHVLLFLCTKLKLIVFRNMTKQREIIFYVYWGKKEINFNVLLSGCKLFGRQECLNEIGGTSLHNTHLPSFVTLSLLIIIHQVSLYVIHQPRCICSFNIFLFIFVSWVLVSYLKSNHVLWRLFILKHTHYVLAVQKYFEAFIDILLYELNI